MKLDQYMLEAERTFPDLGQTTANDLHMTIGMATEACEILDVYKKYLAYGKAKDLVNVQEELGDLMWYLINFCRINNFVLEDILETNIQKLRARYPEKFDADKAINRDLNKEREILEQLGFDNM